jgi:hypothetical protein
MIKTIHVSAYNVYIAQSQRVTSKAILTQLCSGLISGSALALDLSDAKHGVMLAVSLAGKARSNRIPKFAIQGCQLNFVRPCDVLTVR